VIIQDTRYEVLAIQTTHIRKVKGQRNLRAGLRQSGIVHFKISTMGHVKKKKTFEKNPFGGSQRFGSAEKYIT